MKRLFLSIIVISLLFSCLVSSASGDSLIYGGVAKDSREFFTIGSSENTFDGVYKRMHRNLDLKKYPIPEPEISRFEYKDGKHDEFVVLKNDGKSYDYIGYVCRPEGTRRFIIWSWAGYHEDGTLIGVDTYYQLDGKYLGNIQRDYTTGAAYSSRNCPFYYNVGSFDGKK